MELRYNDPKYLNTKHISRVINELSLRLGTTRFLQVVRLKERHSLNEKKQWSNVQVPSLWSVIGLKRGSGGGGGGGGDWGTSESSDEVERGWFFSLDEGVSLLSRLQAERTSLVLPPSSFLYHNQVTQRLFLITGERYFCKIGFSCEKVPSISRLLFFLNYVPRLVTGYWIPRTFDLFLFCYKLFCDWKKYNEGFLLVLQLSLSHVKFIVFDNFFC